jgi:hypothetical protein
VIRARLRSLWRNLVHRNALDRDLDDELAAVHALLMEEKTRAGVPPEPARRAATTIELGYVHIVKEHVRDARADAFLQILAQDVRYGARLLRRNPLFTFTAVLSLAIGIGANTTMFSLLNALMQRELRVENPHELVEVGRITPYGRGGSFSNPIYEALRYSWPLSVCMVCSGIRSHGGPERSVCVWHSARLAPTCFGRCFANPGS